MSRRSRRKGHDFEREIARRLSDATGLDYQRVLVEPRDGNSGDVDAPGSAFTFQCKVGARPSVWRALSEAQEAAPESRTPVGVVKRNGSGRHDPAEEVAILNLSDFLELAGRLTRGREP